MNSLTYAIGFHLPYPLRVAAASAKGYYLRWWRYGPETERLVEEALERESWTSTQWKSWQEERLAHPSNGPVNGGIRINQEGMRW